MTLNHCKRERKWKKKAKKKVNKKNRQKPILQDCGMEINKIKVIRNWTGTKETLARLMRYMLRSLSID
jgi:hypothetical protein